MKQRRRRQTQATLKAIFKGIEAIRKRARLRPGSYIKDFINEGRF
jgi:hypothetical protein